MPVSILMVVDLPGAVGSDVADHGAGLDGQRDAVDGAHFPALATEPALADRDR